MNNLPVDLTKLVSFFGAIENGDLGNNQAKIVMRDMLSTGDDPQSIIQQHGFDQAGLSDEALSDIVDSVLQKNP